MLSLTLLCYTQVHYYPHSQVWELRILVADWGDAGHYTCKTNTVPYRQELVTLVVRDTVAVIAGQEEKIIKEGSRLLLHCVVELGKGPNKHFRSVAVLHWFVNQRLVDPAGGHEVGEVETRVRLGRNMEGWLSIMNTSSKHSGNYSCVPSYTKPAWVMVHIVPGNTPLLLTTE